MCCWFAYLSLLLIFFIFSLPSLSSLLSSMLSNDWFAWFKRKGRLHFKLYSLRRKRLAFLCKNTTSLSTLSRSKRCQERCKKEISNLEAGILWSPQISRPYFGENTLATNMSHKFLVFDGVSEWQAALPAPVLQVVNEQLLGAIFISSKALI